MTNDRELLELAAKAAGIEYTPAELEVSKVAELKFGLWLKFPDGYEVPEGVRRRWNPLTDDGDALRLAVKLNLSIRICNGVCVVDDGLSDLECEEVNKVDYAAATRRAIVRAAAETGKGMHPFPTTEEIEQFANTEHLPEWMK